LTTLELRPLMKVIRSISKLRESLSFKETSNNKIGLVPTMGALHNGHLELVKRSIKECDITIVSIFVNPSQFNSLDDLEKYPKTLDKDLDLLSSISCDIVFAPAVGEMYDGTPEPVINFGEIESFLEGKHRSDHFQGVGQIVSKFFKIIEPTHTFFGQKDLQQFHIVKSLILNYGFPIELICVPTVREKSGLAMSSRNERLSKTEREKAALIYESLQVSKKELLNGVQIAVVKRKISDLFKNQIEMELEYFEMVDTTNFSVSSEVKKYQTAICIAVNIGDVRLIDNILLIS